MVYIRIKEKLKLKGIDPEIIEQCIRISIDSELLIKSFYQILKLKIN